MYVPQHHSLSHLDFWVPDVIEADVLFFYQHVEQIEVPLWSDLLVFFNLLQAGLRNVVLAVWFPPIAHLLILDMEVELITILDPISDGLDDLLELLHGGEVGDEFMPERRVGETNVEQSFQQISQSLVPLQRIDNRIDIEQR